VAALGALLQALHSRLQLLPRWFSGPRERRFVGSDQRLYKKGEVYNEAKAFAHSLDSIQLYVAELESRYDVSLYGLLPCYDQLPVTAHKYILLFDETTMERHLADWDDNRTYGYHSYFEGWKGRWLEKWHELEARIQFLGRNAYYGPHSTDTWQGGVQWALGNSRAFPRTIEKYRFPVHTVVVELQDEVSRLKTELVRAQKNNSTLRSSLEVALKAAAEIDEVDTELSKLATDAKILDKA
jgi:hypothetical protein